MSWVSSLRSSGPRESQSERAWWHRREYLSESEWAEFERLRRVGKDPDSGDVLIYMYDTTDGALSALDPASEAIWHTSIVVFGTEYYYGNAGITKHEPETTCFGEPVRIVFVDEAQCPRSQAKMFLNNLRGAFRDDNYNLLTHNCNTFTHRAAHVICGRFPNRIKKLKTFVH